MSCILKAQQEQSGSRPIHHTYWWLGQIHRGGEMTTKKTNQALRSRERTTMRCATKTGR